MLSDGATQDLRPHAQPYRDPPDSGRLRVPYDMARRGDRPGCLKHRGDRAYLRQVTTHGPHAAIADLRFSSHAVHRLTGAVRTALLAQAPNLHTPNFTRLGNADLTLLFREYDARFFGGALRTRIEADHAHLVLRPSSRMTSRGGQTQWRRHTQRRGRILATRTSYEIAIAEDLVLQAFNEDHRAITVNGLLCNDRLDAVQRIFEHELVHLTEILFWSSSSCRGSRFQSLAQRLFGHTEFTHKLITRRERARVQLGIEIGDRVSFACRGNPRTGIVNRITKRATVLVRDDQGRLYGDGHRYRAYYVPVARLEAH